MLVGGAVLGLPALFDKPPRPADQTFQVRLSGGESAAAVSTKTPPAAGLAVPAGSAVAASVPPGSAVALAAAGAVAAAAVLPGTGRKPPADEAIITESKVDPKAEAAERATRQAREQAAAEKLRADKARAERLKAEQVREAEKAERAEKARIAAKKAKEAKDAQDARDAAEARREAARKDKDAKAAKAAKEARDSKVDKSAKSGSEGDKPRRYVIQAGSFAEAAAARDLGRRIDKLGLDSHEQRVETASGSARTRVRLGPFSSKEDALRAAARLKAAGLNAAVLPL